MQEKKQTSHKLSVTIAVIWMMIVPPIHAQSVSDTGTPESTAAKTALLFQTIDAFRKKLTAQEKDVAKLQRDLQMRDSELQEALQELQALRGVAEEAHPSPAPFSPRLDQRRLNGVVEGPGGSAGSSEGKREAIARATAGKTEEGNQTASYGEKLSLGGLVFGDYGYYYHTGFGPQFLTQINPPGPGNNGYNSFDITRAYIDFRYSPSTAVTLRVTPNIYRQLGAAPAAPLGSVSAAASNTSTELTYRLKYAYADFKNVFTSIESLKGDTLTVGQQPNVLVDWEENLYGFRWVNLTPWNYLSLSSAQTGVAIHGPVNFGHKQYLDYAVGLYDNANFHTSEQSESKQVMGRLSFYPFGAVSTFQGIGLTGAFDYGYANVTPDTPAHFPIYRLAALAHYSSKHNGYGIAGEYDRGRNSFTSANLFSGSGPADEFGLRPTSYANFDALAQTLLNYNGTEQQGFALFGHSEIPRSNFTLFGMDESFHPNTRVFRNPLDFNRLIAGIAYKYNDHVRFSLDSQNLFYTQSRFSFPVGELAQFNPNLAAQNLSGIANAVPQNINALFFNVEIRFNRELLSTR